MTKNVSMLAAAPLLIALLAGCETTSEDMGWERTQGPETPVRITLDRSAFAGEEHFRGETSAGTEFPRAFWISRLGDRRGSLPRLVVTYAVHTVPGQGYAEAWPVAASFRETGYEYFENRRHEIRDARELVVRGLPVEVADVVTDGVGCFAFSADFGESAPGMVGDRTVAGYYCRRGEEPITDAEAMDVLSAISTPAWR